MGSRWHVRWTAARIALRRWAIYLALAAACSIVTLLTFEKFARLWAPAPAADAAMAPVVPVADIRAGMDSFVKGNLREAEIAVSRILHKDPANETGLLLRGSLFLQTKRFDEALQDFDRIIEKKSSPPEVLADALSSRGRTLALMGRQSAAVKDYTRCLSIAPPNWKQRAVIEKLLHGTGQALENNFPGDLPWIWKQPRRHD